MPLVIEDEFSHIPSKGMRQYFRRKRDGLCPFCGNLPEGKPTGGTYVFCARHRRKKKEHYQQAYKPEPNPNRKGRKSKYARFIETRP